MYQSDSNADCIDPLHPPFLSPLLLLSFYPWNVWLSYWCVKSLLLFKFFINAFFLLWLLFCTIYCCCILLLSFVIVINDWYNFGNQYLKMKRQNGKKKGIKSKESYNILWGTDVFHKPIQLKISEFIQEVLSTVIPRFNTLNSIRKEGEK